MATMTIPEITPKMSLPYGVFSTALYFSSLPFPHEPDANIQAYAWEGVEVLGGIERAEDLYHRSVELGEMLQRRKITDKEYAEAITSIWPKRDRLECCIGCDLGRFLP